MGNLAGLIAAAPSTRILAEGLEFRVDDQGVDTTIKFWVHWSDLPAFRNYVVGYPATPVVIGGVTVNRMIPMSHPYEYNCYAASLRIAPAPETICTQDATGHGFQFEEYFADVQFRTPKYQIDVSPYPLSTVRRQAGSEMVTVPGSAYKFPSDSARVNHEVGVPVGCVHYSITLHRMPALSNSLYDGLTGCVNLTTFFGGAPGTMLFEGASSGGELSLGGIPSFEVTLELLYRAVPHNQIMRSDGSAFEAPVAIGSGNPMLPIAELNNLWT